MKLLGKWLFIGLVGGLTVTGLQPAWAILPGSGPTAVTPDGNWNSFLWSLGGGSAVSFEEPFTFDILPGNVGIVDVTDIGTSGDQYEVIDNGISLGETSIPLELDLSDTDDPDITFLDEQWSSGTFMVESGSHELGFVVTRTGTLLPLTFGGARFRITMAPAGTAGVPEPSTTIPLIALCSAVFGFRRSRS